MLHIKAKQRWYSYIAHLTCCWTVAASKRRDNNLRRIIVWTLAHSCYSIVERNNNRSLTSKDVASHILSQILVDVTFKAKQIQVYIKDKLHVDITYSKAWTAQRKAIESIYITWDDNFELPKFLGTLQLANPGTIVQWLHHSHVSSECAVFKYVFWVFRPSIRAFHYCQLVISVDGTHLNGPYRGKFLIAVSKNANNHIFPVAYAIVDEETYESWMWFFKQFREHIVNKNMGSLCAIYDRHKGIIKEMETLEEWKEPNAYHRFCLRHIVRNLGQNFKSATLKRICWVNGSTTCCIRYLHSIKQMKAINQKAWDYLNSIDKIKCIVVHDKSNRRQANLTTNISESLNNVLWFARLLPIKACI
ncbi:uncharacterized protein LOC143551097 [Bidens hawaiensis]|uniref:uncharacterized protein LOC143551097 n=1 Tax=Bidens hawaiensis TaxID=980011 RepID=UPI00404B172E